MTSRAFAAAVRRALEERSSPDNKQASERYFLGVTLFLGVRSPQVRAVLQQVAPLVTDPVRDALALLPSPFMEERQLAAYLLGKHKKHLPDAIVDDLAQYFDAHVHDWGTCDSLSSQVLREMIRRDGTRAQVVAWSRANNPWRQRAAAVAFVNEARSGRYNDDIIIVCERIVKTKHRFVQLGCGWVLRELSLADRPRVLAFIHAHAKDLSREGLRYAIEKLPPRLRADVLRRPR